jgi:hypothetical protein
MNKINLFFSIFILYLCNMTGLFAMDLPQSMDYQTDEQQEQEEKQAVHNAGVAALYRAVEVNKSKDLLPKPNQESFKPKVAPAPFSVNFDGNMNLDSLLSSINEISDVQDTPNATRRALIERLTKIVNDFKALQNPQKRAADFESDLKALTSEIKGSNLSMPAKSELIRKINGYIAGASLKQKNNNLRDSAKSRFSALNKNNN